MISTGSLSLARAFEFVGPRPLVLDRHLHVVSLPTTVGGPRADYLRRFRTECCVFTRRLMGYVPAVWTAA